MISIIIPVKNRLRHLMSTLHYTRKQSKVDYEIIIVDYTCPDDTYGWLCEGFKDDKKIIPVKVEVEENEWNLSAARNQGYKMSNGEILCFIDADTCITHDFLSHHLKKMNPSVFISGTINWCSGCCIINKSDFELARGYNETLEGWGSEDLDLYNRLEKSGIKKINFNHSMLKNIPHADDIRNEYHGKTNIHDTNRFNYEKSLIEFKGL